MKKLIFKLVPVIDLLLAIPTWLAAWVLKIVRRIGVHRVPVCRQVLLSVGGFPIRNHYHEPQHVTQYAYRLNRIVEKEPM